MPFQFRKRISIGHGFSVNFSKSGVSLCHRGKITSFSFNPFSGRKSASVRIPGSGLSWRKSKK